MNKKHHFPHICIDPYVYDKVDNVTDFVNISREESRKQTYYHSPAENPERGPNKYFGDTGEYFTEILLTSSEIDKNINCSNWRPLDVDEFGVDGEGFFTVDSGKQLKLGTQTKISVNNNHYYNGENSNIMNAVAAISTFNYSGLLFINFAKGISPKLFHTFNSVNPKNVRQLNYKELNQITYHNTTFWNKFRDNLRLT